MLCLSTISPISTIIFLSPYIYSFSVYVCMYVMSIYHIHHISLYTFFLSICMYAMSIYHNPHNYHTIPISLYISSLCINVCTTVWLSTISPISAILFLPPSIYYLCIYVYDVSMYAISIYHVIPISIHISVCMNVCMLCLSTYVCILGLSTISYL